MSLIVASLVNNQWLSAAMIASGKHDNTLSPADMESVKRQIVSLKKMAKESTWYEIVRDAFEYNSRIKAWFDRDINYASGGNGKNNPLGLTSEGVKLLREMIRLRMPIDIAHLPLKSQRQIYTIVAQENNYYPIFNSHTRLEALLKAEDKGVLKEHLTTDEVLGYVRRTGGVLGLRTGEEAMLDYPQPRKGQSVANNCDGSSRSFTQFYQYADDLGVKLAFGSDFNGFITQMPPRFGEDACASAPTSASQHAQALAQGVPANTAEFNEKGLAHIGLLPGLLKDMRTLGADTDNIANSAEHFIQMWERIYQPHRSAIP